MLQWRITITPQFAGDVSNFHNARMFVSASVHVNRKRHDHYYETSLFEGHDATERHDREKHRLKVITAKNQGS